MHSDDRNSKGQYTEDRLWSDDKKQTTKSQQNNKTGYTMYNMRTRVLYSAGRVVIVPWRLTLGGYKCLSTRSRMGARLGVVPPWSSQLAHLVLASCTSGELRLVYTPHHWPLLLTKVRRRGGVVLCGAIGRCVGRIGGLAEGLRAGSSGIILLFRSWGRHDQRRIPLGRERAPALTWRGRKIKRACTRQARWLVPVLGNGLQMRTIVERRVLVVRSSRLSLPMLDAELIFEISGDPGLADDVLVQGHIGLGEEFDKEARGDRYADR